MPHVRSRFRNAGEMMFSASQTSPLRDRSRTRRGGHAHRRFLFIHRDRLNTNVKTLPNAPFRAMAVPEGRTTAQARYGRGAHAVAPAETSEQHGPPQRGGMSRRVWVGAVGQKRPLPKARWDRHAPQRPPPCLRRNARQHGTLPNGRCQGASPSLGTAIYTAQARRRAVAGTSADGSVHFLGDTMA